MSDQYRDHRFESPDLDDDPDFQLALRLSAELNGETTPTQGTSSNSQPSYDDDADFALAVQLQFESENAEQLSHDAPDLDFNWEGPATPSSDVAPWGKGKSVEHTATYLQECQASKTFGSLPEFVTNLRAANCSRCHEVFFRSGLDVSQMLQEWKDGKSTLSSLLKCRCCSTVSCVACIPPAFTNQSTLRIQGKQLSWCCSGGRILLLWLVLCGFDEYFSAKKLKEATKPKEQRSEDDRSKRSSQSGVGFGGAHRYGIMPISSMPNGTGYGSHTEVNDYWSPHYGAGKRIDATQGGSNDKSKFMSAQQVEDEHCCMFLELVQGLLPSFERETTFDYDPPEVVGEMILESKILNYCAELLRNDSLSDATKRRALYQTLIIFLRTLSAHYVTASRAIYIERPLRDDKINLLTLAFAHRTDGVKEKGCSLFKSLGNLNAQSNLVLQGAKTNEKDFLTDDGQNLLLLCHNISDLYQDLNTNSGASASAKINSAEPEVPSLLEVPDQDIFATYSFSKVAKSLRAAPHGRFKRLITEITTLKTSLPPGIFVRYAESRPDVQKAVIIGPVGTPYENGIFEFDIYCDVNFPNNPPSVKFKTTGGGRVAFNPNLYADGKVCLSLLGTWQGEPWVPNESTLLQVLVSLQGLILCEEPWYNEPGRETTYHRGSGGPAESYNQIIRQHTVRTAMLDWLENPSVLWKGVVEQHFRENANKILQKVEKWSNNKVASKPYTPFGEDEEMELMASAELGPPFNNLRDINSMISPLQSALKRYGATYVIARKPQAAARQTVVSSARPPPPMIPSSAPPHMTAYPPVQPPPPYASIYPAPCSPTNPVTLPTPPAAGLWPPSPTTPKPGFFGNIFGHNNKLGGSKEQYTGGSAVSVPPAASSVFTGPGGHILGGNSFGRGRGVTPATAPEQTPASRPSYTLGGTLGSDHSRGRGANRGGYGRNYRGGNTRGRGGKQWLER